jgi:hypothetical protein
MKKNRILLIGLSTLITVVVFVFYYSIIYRPMQTGQSTDETDTIAEGDIVFQTTKSEQTKAVQLATHSEYDHCGLVCKEGDSLFVFEAVFTIRKTPLDKWINRGVDRHYAIKRLKNSKKILTPEKLKLMRFVASRYDGKDYDANFEWSDDRIYCSELVWKIYKISTGLEIGKLQKLSDFDLTNGEVKRMMNERYGEQIPVNETVISPVDIYNSELLEMVKTY